MNHNKEANDKFEEAIKEYLEAYGLDDGFLVDWTLIVAHHIEHEDGYNGTSLATYVSHDQAVHRTLGLLSYATIRTTARINNSME